jgi:flagellar motor switch protein FliG
MKPSFTLPKWVFPTTLTLIGATLLGVYLIQSDVLTRLKSPPPTPAEKVERSVQGALSRVLDGLVGEGKYHVSVKAALTNNFEESESITLTPQTTTSSQRTEVTSQSERTQPDPESLKAYFEKQPAQKITKAMPGFPVLNPVNEKTVPEIPTKTVQVPAKTTETVQNTHLYFNQEKTKKVTPIRIQSILVQVVIDERMMKVNQIDKTHLTALLAEIANIQEDRGDRLVVNTYPFSNAIFGLDQFVVNLKQTIKDLGWPPEWFAALFAGIIGLILLTLLFVLWRAHREHIKLEKALEEEDRQTQAIKDAEAQEREFQAHAKAVIEFAKSHPTSTARVLSELISNASNPPSSELSPLQKALIFILFLQTDHAETVNTLLTEMGETLSKTLLQSLEKQIKVDTSTLHRVIEEFYQLLVKKQTVIGGPSLSQKLLTSAFGETEAPQQNTPPFAFLEAISNDKLIAFLHTEPPQLSALIFSFLPESRTAVLLSQLDLDLATQISKKLLNLHVPNFTWIQHLSAALEVHLLAPNASGNIQEKVAKLSKIVEQTPSALRQHLLQEFEAEDPGITQKIKALMLTFEDLDTLSDEDIKTLAFECGAEQVGIALLKSSEDFKATLISALSDRMIQLIQYIDSTASRFSDTDIEAAQMNLVATAKALQTAGKITLPKSGDPR